MSINVFPLLPAQYVPTCLLSVSQETPLGKQQNKQKNTLLRIVSKVGVKLFWMVWTCKDHVQTSDMASDHHLALSTSFLSKPPLIKHLLHARHYAKCTTGIISFNSHKDILRCIVTSQFCMWGPRPRAGKSFAWCHTAIMWQSQELKKGLCVSVDHSLTASCCREPPC